MERMKKMFNKKKFIVGTKIKPYINRYFSDLDFNARVILIVGLIMNIVFAIFNIAIGIWYRSIWFATIAVYYIALCGIKLILVKNDILTLKSGETDILREWKTYRTVGWLLLFLNCTLSGIMVLVIRDGHSYSYHGFIIFAVAAYAFYSVIIAVIRLVKGKKEFNPVFSAAKILDLIFAVVAIFTLQTAMLSTFGNNDYLFIAVFNSISGIATCLFVLGSAIFMLIRAHISIPQIKREETDNG